MHLCGICQDARFPIRKQGVSHHPTAALAEAKTAFPRGFGGVAPAASKRAPGGGGRRCSGAGPPVVVLAELVQQMLGRLRWFARIARLGAVNEDFVVSP